MPPFDPSTARPARERQGGFDPSTARPTSRQSAQPPASRRGQAAPIRSEISGALANVNRGIPFAQDLQGIVRGAMSAGGVAATPGTSLGDIARAGIQGYRGQIQEGQELAADFRERRPNVGALAEGTGMALGIAPALRAPAAVASTARGLPLFARQSAEAGATGAVYGAAYGAGTGDAPSQPWQDRVQMGNEGAALGGVLGLATPAIANAAGAAIDVTMPAWRALANPRPIATQAAESGAGTFGGQAFSGAGRGGRGVVRPPTATGAPPTPPAAANMIDRLADRARMTPDQVEAAFASARANPQGEVVADVFNQAGRNLTRSLAQSPGQTGDRALEVARERILRAPSRIDSALRGNLFRRGENANMTRFDAMERLENDYRDVASQAYAPLFARGRLGPREQALYEERIAPLLDPDNPNEEVRRIMQRALRQARRQFDLDRQVGRVTGTFDENVPRTLHYIKQELGNIADFEAVNLRGTSGNRTGTLRQFYRQFADLLDPPENGQLQGAIIPGYRQVTAQAGDYFTARRAIREGEQWINQSPQAVRAARERMTPFELYHARVSLADEINHLTRGRLNRNQNVAAKLDDPAIQDAIREAFDTPEQAANFLGTVNRQDELAQNAIGWGGGSSTWANATHATDEALNTLAEAGGRTARGDLAGGAGRVAQGVYNWARGGALERANNAKGETLLTRIDTEDSASFARAVVAELRRREAARRARSAASRAGAALGGANQRRSEQ